MRRPSMASRGPRQLRRHRWGTSRRWQNCCILPRRRTCHRQRRSHEVGHLMGLFDWFTKRKSPSSSAPPVAWAEPPAEWKKEFADRREAFIAALHSAVAGSADVESRVFDGEDGYGRFSEWVDGRLVYHDGGTLR